MPSEEKSQSQVGLELWTFQYAVQCYHQVTSNLHAVSIQSSLISRFLVQWPWNEAIHTICLDKIQSLLPSGSLSELSSQVHTSGEVMGITTRIAYTQNTTGVQIYYIKKIRCHSCKFSSGTGTLVHIQKGTSQGTRLLYTVTMQSRVLTDTCRLQVVVRGGAPHS